MPRAGCSRRDSEPGISRSRFDQYVVTLDLDWVASELDARVVQVRAGGDVVLPSMPRTSDRGAVQFAFSEWPAAMLAGVVDRKKFSARVEQRNLPARRLDGFAATIGNLGRRRDFDKACHLASPPRVRLYIPR